MFDKQSSPYLVCHFKYYKLNLVQTLKFEEEYRSALEEFARASELNPSWINPRKLQEQLVQYLDNTVDLIQANGRLKAKRLQAMLQVVYCSPYSSVLLTRIFFF